MTFSLDRVVPWGRCADEYRRMFSLDDSALESRILGCGDGPASFNAQWTAAGGNVVSCDPLYRFTAEQIQQRIDQARAQITTLARRNRDQFIWSERIPDVDSMVSHRMATMNRFLADYDQGLQQGRYVDASLPHLPFDGDSFDLSICSHFLFLYSNQLSESFHNDSIHAMLRVAKEVRIFPLLDLDARRSRHVAPVVQGLRRQGHLANIETVDYEFQCGANQMLRIVRRRPTCPQVGKT